MYENGNIFKDRKKNYCSFCGKSQDEVPKLFSGQLPNVFICSDCVHICSIMLRGDRPQPDIPPKGRRKAEKWIMSRSLRWKNCPSQSK